MTIRSSRTRFATRRGFLQDAGEVVGGWRRRHRTECDGVERRLGAREYPPVALRHPARLSHFAVTAGAEVTPCRPDRRNRPPSTEERRVGKGSGQSGKSGWAACHDKKK